MCRYKRDVVSFRFVLADILLPNCICLKRLLYIYINAPFMDDFAGVVVLEGFYSINKESTSRNMGISFFCSVEYSEW